MCYKVRFDSFLLRFFTWFCANLVRTEGNTHSHELKQKPLVNHRNFVELFGQLLGIAN